LINKEATQQYWRRHNKSDSKTTSKWEHIWTDGSDIMDIHGEDLEIDPPQKPVVTWNTPDQN